MIPNWFKKKFGDDEDDVEDGETLTEYLKRKGLEHPNCRSSQVPLQTNAEIGMDSNNDKTVKRKLKTDLTIKMDDEELEHLINTLVYGDGSYGDRGYGNTMEEPESWVQSNDDFTCEGCGSLQSESHRDTIEGEEGHLYCSEECLNKWIP